MRRGALSLLLVVVVGCSARAGMALLPQIGVRARARLERSESRVRWRHDVRLVATFRTDAQVPRLAIDAPPDRAPVVALPGRLPCRVRSLCEWERRARHQAFAAFRAALE